MSHRSTTMFGSTGDTRDREHGQREAIGLERALAELAKLLPKGEFDLMEGQVRRGMRDIRIENGFVITCFTPQY